MSSSDGIVDGEAFGVNISMSVFATKLGSYLKRPVLDQTGLTDKYDFHLDPDDPTNTDGPTAVLDVVKRLGLKLTPGKVPIEVIVVDHVERPSEN